VYAQLGALPLQGRESDPNRRPVDQDAIRQGSQKYRGETNHHDG